MGVEALLFSMVFILAMIEFMLYHLHRDMEELIETLKEVLKK